MAELAAAAGLSVGAVYMRFRDKDAFLAFVMTQGFSFAVDSFAEELAGGSLRATRPEARVQRAVSVLAAQFDEPEFAGVVRASVKLGLADPEARLPFDTYRQSVSGHLVEWLTSDSVKQAAQVSAAIDVILGVLTDAALSGKAGGTSQPAAILSSLTHLLRDAMSDAIKPAGKFAQKKASQAQPKNPCPVSALKKPQAKSKPKKSPRGSGTSRIRKI